MATKWDDIPERRKRAIRAEMNRRWLMKLRKKGAAKAAGGDPTKTSGVDKSGKKYGTGSMKGWTTASGQKLTANEINYIKALRGHQKKSGKVRMMTGKNKGKLVDRKATAIKARKTGAGNKKLVTAMSMKDKSRGGTVSYGSHKAVKGKVGGGAKRVAAKAWRDKHMNAAKGTAAQKAAHRRKVQKRFEHMIGFKSGNK